LPNSRSSTASDHSDLIALRAIGKKPNFPFHIKNSIDVFLTIPWLPRIGGVEEYVKCLMEDLVRLGLSPALVITEEDPIGYLDDSIKYRELGNLVIKRTDFPTDAYFVTALERLATHESVVVNFGSSWEFENAIEMKSVFSKRVCFIFNTEISMTRAIKYESDFDEFWVAYKKIKDCLPTSMKSRTHTVYTGVIENSPLQREKFDKSSFTVGFLGRYSPEKNPGAFLELAKDCESESDFKFLIAGEGPLDQQVKRAVSKLKNTENVGYQSDPIRFFSKIDCLVISSDIEGIPLVAMESLSYGIPVISRPVGGMPELLTNEVDGYIWNGNNAEALTYLRTLKQKRDDNKDHPTLSKKFTRDTTSRIVSVRLLELLNK
jgi:glycosyltransferase involved in cell wall biosynthesis